MASWPDDRIGGNWAFCQNPIGICIQSGRYPVAGRLICMARRAIVTAARRVDDRGRARGKDRSPRKVGKKGRKEGKKRDAMRDRPRSVPRRRVSRGSAKQPCRLFFCRLFNLVARSKSIVGSRSIGDVSGVFCIPRRRRLGARCSNDMVDLTFPTSGQRAIDFTRTSVLGICCGRNGEFSFDGERCADDD